jgi:hypothetical protein
LDSRRLWYPDVVDAERLEKGVFIGFERRPTSQAVESEGKVTYDSGQTRGSSLKN